MLKLSLIALMAFLLLTSQAPSDQPPGMLRFQARHRTTPPGSGDAGIVAEAVTLDPHQTALVICDMWDHHWCKSAERRVAEMAPRVNDLANALRSRGVLIIHCPSDTMNYYKDHPGRKLAQSAPKVVTEIPLLNWCNLQSDREAKLPIDDSDGGCPDDPPCATGHPWTHQIDTIQIQPGDAITDSAEAFYLMKQRGITNVLVCGVHENMCVLGRPFSIRQMTRQGQHVLLVRDLTDTMYNPKMPPYVDHFSGTDLMTQHIERYWCSTVTSDQVLGGKAFKFSADRRHAPIARVPEFTITDWHQRDAAVGHYVRVEGIVSNTKIPQIEGIDIDLPSGPIASDAHGRMMRDLRNQKATADGILVKHVVLPGDIPALGPDYGPKPNRGAGVFYRLVDSNTDTTAIARPASE